ncbi:MAG: S-layer homology domain-containing protein [Butyricicoccus sp.]
MKKRILSLLLVVAMLCSLCSMTAFAAESGYTDVNASDWYSEGVQYVSEKGLMSGVENQRFDPQGITTRGMIVAILWRLEGKPAAGQAQFDDVSAEQYYAEAVAWAAANKIVEGYGNGKFGPNDPITREQMAAIFYRYAAVKSLDITTKGDIHDYQDADQISGYAAVPMLWAVEKGLISGTGGAMLEPQAKALRAQAATILMRLDKNILGAETEEPTTFTVTFYANGGTASVSTVRVAKGEKVASPAAPTRSGYTFNGWFTAASGGTKYDFNTAVTADLSLYAQWTEKTSSGGSSGSSSKKTVTSVDILCDGGSAAGKELKQGDELAYVTVPAGATGTVSWKVGGIEKSTAATYTVGALDVGQTITVTFTATGSYKGTQTSAPTGKVASVAVDLSNDDPDASPVVVADGAVYKGDDGSDITIEDGDTVSLSVESCEVAVETVDEEELNTSFASAIGVTITEDDVQDAGVTYVEVNAQMSLKKDGAETAEAIHPVGDTTITLSKENLGIDADVDISDFTFVAKHTNQNGDEEAVTGEVVKIDGIQYVRFELNGLSTIWIGNIPPLTVTFDTAGGTEIPPQKVKFAWYVKDPEAPTRDGYLFTGWNYNLATFQVLRDTTITAKWIQGTKVDIGYLKQVWDPETVSFDELDEAVRPKITYADGAVTVELNSETVYPANLECRLIVSRMDGAAQWATATTGEAAAAATEYSADESELTLTKPVTDEYGKVVTANPSTTLYIKWVDADENVLGVQSATLTIKTEKPALSYDTPTETNTVSVNRGIGRIDSYLTDTDGVYEPFYSYTNAYLGYEQNEYYLDVNQSFNESFYMYDEQTYRGYTISADDYETLHVVIKPFEGETVPALTAEAYRWDRNAEEAETFDAQVTRGANGEVIVTCPIPEPSETSNHIYLHMDLTAGGKKQQLYFSFYFRNNDDDDNYRETDSWSEVLQLLNENDQVAVGYHGEDDITLTSSLTLGPEQSLYMSGTCLTVDNGAVLKLCGNGFDAAHLNAKDIIVKNGTIATNSQNEVQNTYYMSGIYAEEKIVIEEGGLIQVPERGYLNLWMNNDDSTIELHTGAEMQVKGVLDLGSPIDAAGTIRVEGNGNFYCYGGLTIAESGSLELMDQCYVRIDGGMINKGMISVDTEDSDNITFAGSFENTGKIMVEQGWITFDHCGYSIQNRGTITLMEDAALYVNGTVLVNTGSIVGDGRVFLELIKDLSDYDNGVEYVETAGDRTPSNYSRYQFVRDPSATVEEITFFAQLDNRDGGVCTCDVDENQQ